MRDRNSGVRVCRGSAVPSIRHWVLLLGRKPCCGIKLPRWRCDVEEQKATRVFSHPTNEIQTQHENRPSALRRIT